MHQRHTASESGQEGSFLHCRVTAADDGDVLIAEEESVAGGARAHPAPEQFLFAGHLQIACRCAHCQDHGSGPVGLSVGGDDRFQRPVK
ncbi:Uncharacterised protein [Mycobacterium tuberculosis]|nr:Uncharacterised protein [Mycobacterium tuberculosis]CNL70617.1 Uncharacterised protein [Mycobacterium tuberculosis]CNM51470.1 Uncharacterised protein [Mycobacterium tuberculosis]